MATEVAPRSQKKPPRRRGCLSPSAPAWDGFPGGSCSQTAPAGEFGNHPSRDESGRDGHRAPAAAFDRRAAERSRRAHAGIRAGSQELGLGCLGGETGALRLDMPDTR